MIALLTILLYAQPASQPRDAFDFDFLAPAAAASEPTQAQHDLESSIKTRRMMLNIHQGAGFALVALTAASIIVGQLSYSDRFIGPSTARYELPHAIIAYTTFGLFVSTGALALFAPTPLKEDSQGFDRMLLHKIGMYGAAACMIAQIVLGVATRQQEGFLVQRDLAVAHLAIGYAALGLTGLGVGAIVF